LVCAVAVSTSKAMKSAACDSSLCMIIMFLLSLFPANNRLAA
jgi:hypothetical protein